MQLSELELHETDVCGTALTLLAALGDKAALYAQEQAARNDAKPDTADLWNKVTAALSTLVQANAHMELALGLLDSVEDTSVPPHLDAAIVKLGLRPTDDNGTGLAVGDLERSERYFHQRAEHHLVLADAEPDATGKGLHLNIASRYATLRELAGRSIAREAQASRT